MEPANPVVAVVDDDESVRRALRRLIRSLSYGAADFPSAEAFLASLDQDAPACVLVDLHMPGLDGLEMLRRMRARGHDIPTVIITGNSQPDMQQRCLRAGAAAYLMKPLGWDIVFATIQTVIAR